MRAVSLRSISSSMERSSGMFLGQPPQLPSVNDHVKNADLHLENMTAKLRATRAKHLDKKKLRSGGKVCRRCRSTPARAVCWWVQSKGDQSCSKICPMILSAVSGWAVEIDAMELDNAFRVARRARATASMQKLDGRSYYSFLLCFPFTTSTQRPGTECPIQ